MDCAAVRSSPHTVIHTFSHKCTYMIKAFRCSAKNLGLLFTLCSDDYLMRFDAGVLWALSELARAPMHFNVQPFSHFSLSLSFPHPPNPPIFLYWTSKDRRIMLINSTKTSWKTESEDTGVSKHAFVFEKVCAGVYVKQCVSMFGYLYV